MKNSELKPVILRLEAMTEDQTDPIQVRHFNVDGVEKAKVIYEHEKDIFTLIDQNTGEELTFDDIDFLAIELLELLQSRVQRDKNIDN